MHNKRLMNPNGGKCVMPCGKFLPGKFTNRPRTGYSESKSGLLTPVFLLVNQALIIPFWP